MGCSLWLSNKTTKVLKIQNKIKTHLQKKRNIYDPETTLGVKLFTLTNKIYQREDLEVRKIWFKIKTK